MKYKIVSGYSEERITNSINYYLSKGWLLQGGLSVVSTGMSTTQYFQAMVKNETE